MRSCMLYLWRTTQIGKKKKKLQGHFPPTSEDFLRGSEVIKEVQAHTHKSRQNKANIATKLQSRHGNCDLTTNKQTNTEQTDRQTTTGTQSYILGLMGNR